GDAVRNTAARDTLKVDGALSARGATPELFAALQKAGPFGAGNPQPVVALPNHTLTSVGVVGQNHLRISLRASDGGKIGGVAFRAADAPLGQELLQMQGERVHVAGTLSSDNFRGTERVELRLLDAALPEA
ncbi:MAG: single-stranded-DNA-specific exonuclease RecJ, partial [Pseudomonadota bacterium]